MIKKLAITLSAVAVLTGLGAGTAIAGAVNPPQKYICPLGTHPYYYVDGYYVIKVCV